MAATYLKLASVHFHTLRGIRNYRATPYEIPGIASPTDPPNFLSVKNLIETQQNSYGGHRTRQVSSRNLTPQEICNCLIREWTTTGLYTSDAELCYPGVWILREEIAIVDKEGLPILDEDKVPLTRTASSHEKEEMYHEDLARCRQATANFGRKLINVAHMIAADPKQNSQTPIGPLMRKAAMFYGENALWVHAHENTKVPCAFCQTMVNKETIICPHCTQTLDYARYEEMVLRGKEAAKAQRDYIDGVIPLKTAGMTGAAATA